MNKRLLGRLKVEGMRRNGIWKDSWLFAFYGAFVLSVTSRLRHGEELKQGEFHTKTRQERQEFHVAQRTWLEGRANVHMLW